MHLRKDAKQSNHRKDPSVVFLRETKAAEFNAHFRVKNKHGMHDRKSKDEQH